MYFVKYIYKVHFKSFLKYIWDTKKCELQTPQQMCILKYMYTTSPCTLAMYLTNVRKIVSMNTLLDVHMMYITMHICNVHY